MEIFFDRGASIPCDPIVGKYYNPSFEPKFCNNFDNETFSESDQKKIAHNVIGKTADIFESDKHLICVKDKESRYITCNQKMLDYTQFSSKNQIIGHFDRDLPWAEGENFYKTLDSGTLEGRTYKTLMPLRIKSNEEIFVFQKKSPIYNNNKIEGIFIQLTVLPHSKLEMFCAKTLYLPELNNYISNRYLIRKTYLDNITETESMCFFYAIRGKTAKEIGKILNKSFRTIEIHLENIRNKLNLTNKVQLISYGIENGFLYMIPEALFHLNFSE